MKETSKVRLTPRRIDKYTCAKGKKQSFLWDTDSPGLAVRATPTRKTFVYESKFNGKTIRITIGNVEGDKQLNLEDARNRATSFRLQISKGIDPRLEKKRRIEQEELERLERKKQNITIAEIWPDYLKDRKSSWSERHYLDHVRLTHPGGAIKKRGKGTTVPGALHSIINKPLADITSESVIEWIVNEKKKRATQTRLGFEALRAFLNWCDSKVEYKGLTSPDACSAKVKKNNLPKKIAKDDCLQKEQLSAWFTAVRKGQNQIISSYLQSLLLTGARREELLHLRWSDVNFTWKTMKIKDKVEGERTIPLTPYVSSILIGLPQRNQWVFSSPKAKSGRLQEPSKAHIKALTEANIEGLSLHGLRRSFGTLSEWVEVPAGIVYQIQGHKPSATAEKHYRKRPIDLLRKWHAKIESWILEQADIVQPEADSEKPDLKIAKTADL